MPSTYSPNLRIELIGSGEQANTWGNTTNTNLGTLIEQAIAGMATVDVTAGDVTLTALNGASDQSRQMILNVTGTPGVARTLIAPAVTKIYVIANGSDAAISVETAGAGASVTLPAGFIKLIYSDGTDFFAVDDTKLLTADRAAISSSVGVLTTSTTTSTEIGYVSGVTSAIQPQINAKVDKAGDTMTGDLLIQASLLSYSLTETKTAPTIISGDVILDCAASNVFAIYLNASINTLTFTNIPVSPIAYGLTLSITTDGTARTITWPATVKWPGGVAPIISSLAGGVDTFVLYTYNGGVTWYAFIAGQGA